MRFIRDPLFVFIVVGVLLFAIDSTRQEESADRNIVVSKNDIRRLSDQWLSQMGNEPSSTELDGLIDAHVREEMFVREARKLGLEHDDVIIRRRLAQKLQFVVKTGHYLKLRVIKRCVVISIVIRNAIGSPSD
ncbi:MAG: hypothetical protein CM1200mP9_11430 [Gammaproteobacteria bacterium]|nr:MAG: hypothetical protein CM1200mP9_11430 [Gammaproteobacteria bacterium]